jgi:hypothetical protein
MARIAANTACPIFASPDGSSFNASAKFGEFGQAAGVSMSADPDGNTMGLLGLYPELKAADAVLANLAVVAGLYSRFLVNKAQTNDVSCFGAELQMRVKANLGTGQHAGARLYWEQSGTVTTTDQEAGAICSVESETGLTATYLSGLGISSAVHASATVTNFSAVRVWLKASCKPFDYIIDVAGTGQPVVGLMRLTAVANVIVSSGSLTKTEAGYLIVYIGSTKRYIPLYSA